MKANFATAAIDDVKDHMLNLVEQHIEKKLQTRKMTADEPGQLK